MPRLFISVDLPETVESSIRRIQSRLRTTEADLNYVDPEKAHVTVKFLGDTAEESVPEITGILDDVASRFSSFTAKVRGTGVFPNREYISVVWAGIGKGGRQLSSIHEEVEERVVGNGLADEEQHDFRPHITLARMNSGRGKSQVRRFLDETENVEICEFGVTGLRLKRSVLESDGPVYDTLYEAPIEENP